MRLWTLHPRYLDAKGLLAAWREGLLAQKVLEGKTRGYVRHPQLSRFRASEDPRASIGRYLRNLVAEADARGYRFDRSKILWTEADTQPRMPVNAEQIAYEFELLKWKLRKRDPKKYESVAGETEPALNEAFERRPGGVESWEKPIAELLPLIGEGRPDPVDPTDPANR